MPSSDLVIAFLGLFALVDRSHYSVAPTNAADIFLLDPRSNKAVLSLPDHEPRLVMACEDVLSGAADDHSTDNTGKLLCVWRLEGATISFKTTTQSKLDLSGTGSLARFKEVAPTLKLNEAYLKASPDGTGTSPISTRISLSQGKLDTDPRWLTASPVVFKRPGETAGFEKKISGGVRCSLARGAAETATITLARTGASKEIVVRAGSVSVTIKNHPKPGPSGGCSNDPNAMTHWAAQYELALNPPAACKDRAIPHMKTVPAAPRRAGLTSRPLTLTGRLERGSLAIADAVRWSLGLAEAIADVNPLHCPPGGWP